MTSWFRTNFDFSSEIEVFSKVSFVMDAIDAGPVLRKRRRSVLSREVPSILFQVTLSCCWT